jgi:hypothetical protein
VLITQTVKLKWNGSNRKHLESKGYSPFEFNKEIEVKIEDLKHGSNAKIQLLCDYCLEEGKETIISVRYETYLRQKEKSPIKKDCCKQCTSKKIK